MSVSDRGGRHEEGLRPLNQGKRAWLRSALSRYWPTGADLITRLPVAEAGEDHAESLPPKIEMVALPQWAADLGVAGGLLVPSAAIRGGAGPAAERTDWWAAAAWYLEGSAERAHENQHGPIHSYSIRLTGWDPRLWDHAWVNRIALLLRRSAARHFECGETATFGPLPDAEILLTHDVDALRKTLRIRVKQSSFDIFNALRAIGRGDGAGARQKVAHGARFLIGAGDYWTFDRLCRLEEAHGLRSTFHVYAGPASARSVAARLILDPSYDVRDAAVTKLIRTLAAHGWTIGLHQSFGAWKDPRQMRLQKELLEQAAGVEVTACRQHWLRFSWAETWAAQEAAGLGCDSTLGFNDRPGFRTGCALRVHPLDDRGEPRRLASVPLVLMDSHLYDYAAASKRDPKRETARWIDEIRFVRGTASVLWHPHVLSDDYGWAAGYEDLLHAVA